MSLILDPASARAWLDAWRARPDRTAWLDGIDAIASMDRADVVRFGLDSFARALRPARDDPDREPKILRARGWLAKAGVYRADYDRGAPAPGSIHTEQFDRF